MRDRASLHGRLGEVKCPIMWLHGGEDEVCSVEVAKGEIAMFGSGEKKVEVLGGGTHFLSWSMGDDVNGWLLEFVQRYGAGEKAKTP